MVSIWPKMDKQSENYDEMRQRGLLVRTERGVPTTMEFSGATVFFDATNPESQAYVWEKGKQNYLSGSVSMISGISMLSSFCVHSTCFFSVFVILSVFRCCHKQKNGFLSLTQHRTLLYDLRLVK